MSLPTTIVVGTDFSEQAEKATEYALELAQQFKARLHLVYSWQMPVPVASEAVLYTGEVINQIEDDAEKAMEANLKRYRARWADVDGSVECGDPRDLVVKLAAEKKAGLIVVGTHGRHGLRRALLGSVAESVVRSAPCPVLVVR